MHIVFALLFIGSLTPTCFGQDLNSAIKSVRFMDANGQAKTTIVPRNGKWGTYTVRAEIKNPRPTYEDHFVLLSIEEILAPLQLPEDLADCDLKNAISWGHRVGQDNLASKVIKNIPGGKTLTLDLLTLDMIKILSGISDEKSQLWPWALKATVRLVDRDGMILSESTGIIDIPPPGR
jgi:hypothetical protein